MFSIHKRIALMAVFLTFCGTIIAQDTEMGQSNFIKLDVVKLDNFAKIMICLRVNLPQPLIFCFGAWQDRSQCLCLETSLLLSKHP